MNRNYRTEPPGPRLVPPDRAITLVILQTDGCSTNWPATEYVHCPVMLAIGWLRNTSRVKVAADFGVTRRAHDCSYGRKRPQSSQRQRLSTAITSVTMQHLHFVSERVGD